MIGRIGKVIRIIAVDEIVVHFGNDDWRNDMALSGMAPMGNHIVRMLLRELIGESPEVEWTLHSRCLIKVGLTFYLTAACHNQERITYFFLTIGWQSKLLLSVHF